MKKFLLSLAAVIAVAFSANAKDVKDNPNPWNASYLVDGVYSFPGSWAGSAVWLGEEPYDASANDFAYIKISQFSGEPIRFAVEWNKFLKEESWGKSYEQTIVLMKEDGIYYIELDKTSKADGGKTYAEEIRQLVVQDDGKAGSLKVEEIGFCTKAELDEMLGNGSEEGNEPEPTPAETEYIINDPDGSKMGGWGGSMTKAVENNVLVIDNPQVEANNWAVQVAYDTDYEYVVDTEYVFEYDIMGSVEGTTFAAGLQNTNGYVGCGDFGTANVTTEWQSVKLTTKCTGEGAKRLVISVGDYAGKLYLKNIKVYAAGTTGLQKVAADANDGAAFNLFGQQSNGNGFVVKGGKVYLVK